ncbi:phage tail protein [Pseudomonas brassicacearum]|uniref:Phage tail protein n=1 Tax=Pseudomonas brassicacearum TaxID=930166 RepID=A0A423J867_9PSED|nr:phage tail protein [Pseudomonas brassicacearum]RON33885.1 phage tail protein [Pseudomonas brassicacearum]
MKAAARAAAHLSEVKAELAIRNAKAATQIARIQDRIDTLGYGVDAGEVTAEDEAELAALTISIKAWKTYKFSLGKVATQATWPASPNWPTAPAIPNIAADPAAMAPDTV